MPGRWGRAAFLGRARTGEAVVLLVAGGAAKRLVPMRYWAGVLGQPCVVPLGWAAGPPGGPAAGSRGRVERQVAQAVRNACARLPWEPTCLAQMLAAQVMLRQRGAAAVAVIGLKRDAGHEPEAGAMAQEGSWEAHAWLIGAALTITGGRAARGFSATTVFAVPGGLQPADLAVTAGEPASRQSA